MMNSTDIHHDSKCDDRIKCAMLKITILRDRSLFVQIYGDTTHEICSNTKTKSNHKNVLRKRERSYHTIE